MDKKNSNYGKKKQPEIVRANLLDAARRILIEEGPVGFTLESVAKKAGVSKGGLVHHFASKQALLETLAREIAEEFDQGIEKFIESDPEPRGRFIRAYIRASFSSFHSKECTKLISVFNFMLSHNEPLMKFYLEWAKQLLERHEITSFSPKEQMLRYAADGIWTEESFGLMKLSPSEFETLIDYLVRETYCL